jgi:hypothetical protein
MHRIDRIHFFADVTPSPEFRYHARYQSSGDYLA